MDDAQVERGKKLRDAFVGQEARIRNFVREITRAVPGAKITIVVRDPILQGEDIDGVPTHRMGLATFSNDNPAIVSAALLILSESAVDMGADDLCDDCKVKDAEQKVAAEKDIAELNRMMKLKQSRQVK